MRRRPTFRLLALFLAAGLLAPDVLAWWAEGHSILDRAAILALPKDMPEFFRKGGATISSYSMDPDLWRNRKLPALRRTERPEHYLDLELLKGSELPRVLERECGSRRNRHSLHHLQQETVAQICGFQLFVDTFHQGQGFVV